MSLLVAWIDKKVTLVTNDGRNVIGVLRGFDQMCNVVLEHTVERIFSEDAGAEEVPLGLFVVKGDNLYGEALARGRDWKSQSILLRGGGERATDLLFSSSFSRFVSG
mmetsp:Transcript_24752/g.61893  ORF Transcript_24752/g.61893 Transcript_24752/m.61893 type:complete len:107 (-) Transcript_24752:549-869(-)